MAVQSKPVIPQNDNIAHAIAGAGGGLLSTVLTYPLITLSTRAQVESSRSPHDAGFLKAVRRIIAREGVGGLYSGLESALFGIGITNFIYYYWYEWSRAALERRAAVAGGGRARKLTAAESMLAGAIAGSAVVLLTNPIWVVNTRLTTRRHQVDRPAASEGKAEEQGGTKSKTEDIEAAAAAAGPAASPSPSAGLSPTKPRATKPPTSLGTLMDMLRHEGPLSLWAGVLPALVLVANPILQYTLFEQLKDAVEKRRGGARITPSTAFVLGALGKLFATSVTYPYITVKSQMHVAGPGGKKEGMTQAIRRVVRDEGWAGLYKGIGPKLTQSVLTAAFLFAFKDILYEQTVRARMRLASKTIAA